MHICACERVGGGAEGGCTFCGSESLQKKSVVVELLPQYRLNVVTVGVVVGRCERVSMSRKHLTEVDLLAARPTSAFALQGAVTRRVIA